MDSLSPWDDNKCYLLAWSESPCAGSINKSLTKVADSRRRRLRATSSVIHVANHQITTHSDTCLLERVVLPAWDHVWPFHVLTMTARSEARQLTSAFAWAPDLIMGTSIVVLHSSTSDQMARWASYFLSCFRAPRPRQQIKWNGEGYKAALSLSLVHISILPCSQCTVCESEINQPGLIKWHRIE